MLHEKEKAALGCPWDGRKPIWESEKVGSRSDPSRAVRLRCPKCGVSKGSILSDAQESAATKLRMADYPNSKISYQEAAVQVLREDVLAAWNKRPPTKSNKQCQINVHCKKEKVFKGAYYGCK